MTLEELQEQLSPENAPPKLRVIRTVRAGPGFDVGQILQAVERFGGKFDDRQGWWVEYSGALVLVYDYEVQRLE